MTDTVPFDPPSNLHRAGNPGKQRSKVANGRLLPMTDGPQRHRSPVQGLGTGHQL
jgi:hypothetical protein